MTKPETTPETLGDVVNYIGLQEHLVRLQYQVLVMGRNMLKLQERCDRLEQWAERRGS